MIRKFLISSMKEQEKLGSSHFTVSLISYLVPELYNKFEEVYLLHGDL